MPGARSHQVGAIAAIAACALIAVVVAAIQSGRGEASAPRGSAAAGPDSAPALRAPLPGPDRPPAHRRRPAESSESSGPSPTATADPPGRLGALVDRALVNCGARLVGTLLEADGRPVPGALLELTRRADPYSSWIAIRRETHYDDDVAEGARDRGRTDADGHFDLYLSEQVAAAGFGYNLCAYTADGRVEFLDHPRVVAGERYDGLILRLPPTRRLEIEVATVMDLRSIDAASHVDERYRFGKPYRRGGLGVPIGWLDGEGRRYRAWAQRVDGSRLVAHLPPTGAEPAGVEVTLPGHEFAAGPVAAQGPGRFRARLEPQPRQHLILEFVDATPAPRNRSVELSVGGFGPESAVSAEALWVAAIQVDLGRLPYRVAVAIDRRSTDVVTVTGTTTAGLELPLASVDLGERSFEVVRLPDLSLEPESKPWTYPPSAFDVSQFNASAAATLIDAVSGEPVAGARAERVTGTGSEAFHRPASGPSGRYGRLVLGGIEPGSPSAFVVQSDDHVPLRIDVPALSAGERSDLGDVVLERREVGLRLKLVSADGAPAAGRSVLVDKQERVTDAEGRVEFLHLDPIWGHRLCADDVAVVEVLGSPPLCVAVPCSADEEQVLRLRPTRLVEVRAPAQPLQLRSILPLSVGQAAPGFSVPFFTGSDALRGIALEIGGAPDGERWFVVELALGPYLVDLGEDQEPVHLDVEAGDGRQIVTLDRP